MDFLKKNIKYVGVVGCALMVLGNFFTFVTVSVSMFGYSASEIVNFISEDGKFVLALGLIAGTLFLGKQLKIKFFDNKIFNCWWLPIVPIAIALIITIYDAVNVNEVVDEISLSGVDISFGFGFYIIILGIIVGIGSVLFEKFGIKNNNVAMNNNYANQVQPNLSQGMYCNYCGAQMPINTKFCTRCGKQL